MNDFLEIFFAGMARGSSPNDITDLVLFSFLIVD